ncbi:MAG: DNA gyrase inhibitor YacG [Planctomycetota bacterium]
MGQVLCRICTNAGTGSRTRINIKNYINMKHRCPVCNKIVQTSIQEHSKQGISFPFCSKHCKFIDLGAWLDSEYKFVSRLQAQDSDEPSGTSFDVASDNY